MSQQYIGYINYTIDIGQHSTWYKGIAINGDIIAKMIALAAVIGEYIYNVNDWR